MFNIGPMEFVVLAIVGVVVLGPDRLPGFARDAARLLRSLRDTATGARQQLRDELGPEFADLDLRNLNPRTAVQRAVFGDDVPDLRKYSPSAMVRDAIFADPDPDDRPGADTHHDSDVDTHGYAGPDARPRPSTARPSARPATRSDGEAGRRPRPRPRPTTSYDDVT